MIVVDASVALKWVFDEDFKEAAEDLLVGPDVPIAPSLWLLEAGNALWRRQRKGEMSREEAQERHASLRNASVGTTDMEPLAAKALQLAIELSHPIYDCCYLALALVQDTRLATADQTFAQALIRGGYGDRLVFVGDQAKLRQP